MSIASNLSNGLGDFMSFQRGSVQALIEANKALAAGLQEMSKELMSVTQASVETAVSTSSSIAQAKSVQELISLQVAGAKTSYETLVANSTKLSELSMQVATATFAPLAARVNIAANKIEKAAA